MILVKLGMIDLNGKKLNTPSSWNSPVKLTTPSYMAKSPVGVAILGEITSTSDVFVTCHTHSKPANGTSGLHGFYMHLA